MSELKRRKDGKGKPGVFYVEFYQDGARKRISTKTRDKAEAKRKKAVIEREIMRGPDRVTRCPVSKFMAIYWPWAEFHKREATIALEKTVWRGFMKSAQITDLTEITPAHIERWKAEGLARGLSSVSVNGYLRALKAILNWSVNTELLQGNPAGKIKALRVDQGEPLWLSKKEAQRVLAIAETKGPDVFLMFNLGIFAGMRKNEIINARWEWFDFGRAVITLKSNGDFRLKSGRERSVPLHSRLSAVLGPHRRENGYIVAPDRPLVSGKRYRYDPRRIIDSIAKEAGVPEMTLHTLRHSFGSHLALAGVDLFRTQKWLGHRSILTTQVYAHLAPQDSEIERLQL